MNLIKHIKVTLLKKTELDKRANNETERHQYYKKAQKLLEAA